MVRGLVEHQLSNWTSKDRAGCGDPGGTYLKIFPVGFDDIQIPYILDRKPPHAARLAVSCRYDWYSIFHTLITIVQFCAIENVVAARGLNL